MVNENPDLVNSRNSDGRFPLEMAAQTGQMEICLFLLEKGSDVNMEWRGSTALHMAALYGGKTALILLLLDKGADINARTGNGYTPLNLAVVGKQKEIANLLLDRGGEINLENQNITELLSISAAGGIDRIVDLARKNEIDFSFQTMTGSTLLHSAAEGGITELAGWLLSKGLNVEAADIYGVTPLHLAREKGYEDVVAYLRKNGADTAEWRFPELTGKYLDQPPPGETAEIFAPGIISVKEYFEHSCLAFSPDYHEVCWSTDFTQPGFYDIVFLKKENGRWSAPKLAPFSEKDHAGSPVFSYDGNKLYFSSTQPRSEGAGQNDVNIWVVERIGEGWSECVNMGSKINTGGHERFPSVTPDCKYLFFCRVSDGSDFYWADAKIIEDLKPSALQ